MFGILYYHILAGVKENKKDSKGGASKTINISQSFLDVNTVEIKTYYINSEWHSYIGSNEYRSNTI